MTRESRASFSRGRSTADPAAVFSKLACQFNFKDVLTTVGKDAVILVSLDEASPASIEVVRGASRSRFSVSYSQHCAAPRCRKHPLASSHGVCLREIDVRSEDGREHRVLIVEW